MVFALAAVAAFRAEEKKDKEDGFVPMFNGKDLTGWVNVNCAPGTFFVKDGEIITTGKPTGFLRTEKQYENFIADFEWMHVNKTEVGNSGFFVWADPLPAVGTGYTRGIEVQVLVNLEKENAYTSHGDLFSIWGATCKPDRPHPQGWARCLPSERRCKGGGEWNHYIVIAKDGVIKLHVNGKEVSGVSECKPRKGYLALESEGAECHFRNLKIKELPSTNPRPEEVAEVDQGFTNLFNGLDLDGWKAGPNASHWQPRDGVLRYDGKEENKENTLATKTNFGDSEYILDFRSPAKVVESCAYGFHADKGKGVTFILRSDGMFTVEALGSTTSDSFKDLKPAGQWNRLRVSLKGGLFQAMVNGKGRVEVPIAGTAAKGPFVLKPSGAMDFRSLFARELKK